MSDALLLLLLLSIYVAGVIALAWLWVTFVRPNKYRSPQPMRPGEVVHFDERDMVVTHIHHDSEGTVRMEMVDEATLRRQQNRWM